MMEYKKSILSIIFLLIALSFNVTADSPDWDVEVANVCLYQLTAVERGGTCYGETRIIGINHAENVRVKMWIGGYEYDDIEGISEPFDIEPNVIYLKKFWIKLPVDMKPGEYMGYIEVYNGQYKETRTDPVFVEKKKHSLSIKDVYFLGGNVVDAGSNLDVTVRVENIGDKKEEDIKIIVSIPELDISAANYIDELTDYEIDNEDEESSDSNSLLLRIPKNTESGDYNLKVTLDYNRGHDSVTDNYKITINGKEVKKDTQNDDYDIFLIQANSQTDISDNSKNSIGTINLGDSFKIAFVALIIILVILGLILGFNRLKGE